MLSVLIELTQFAPTQSAVMDFNSFCRLGDTYLAVNENGIYSINEDADAAGTDIDAYFKLVRSDFGIPNQKRLRSMYVGYEASGSLLVTITPDEDTLRTKTFILPPVWDAQEQHSNRIPLRRDLRGRYFDFKIENIDGCDFSIDSIDLIVTILGKKPRGR